MRAVSGVEIHAVILTSRSEATPDGDNPLPLLQFQFFPIQAHAAFDDRFKV
jgi:hypothetical protein